jgi:glycosyltransferase involved in cell wall biosynthesis
MRNNNISGLIITRNQEQTIKKSVESLQNQDESLDKIIIFDDISTDSTNSILQKIIKKDKRVIVIKPDMRVGPSGALNAGISVCNTQYLIFSGGDDYSLSSRSKIQKSILSNNKNINLLYNRALINGENHLFHPIELDLLKEQTQINKELFAKLFWNLNFLCAPASAVSLSKKNVFRFNDYLIQLQDFYLNLQLASKNQLLWDPTIVVNYSKSYTSLSGQVSNKESASYKRFFNEITFIYSNVLEMMDVKTIIKIFADYLPQQVCNQNLPDRLLKLYLSAFLYLSHDNAMVRSLGKNKLMEIISNKLFDKRIYDLFNWRVSDFLQEFFD